MEETKLSTKLSRMQLNEEDVDGVLKEVKIGLRDPSQAVVLAWTKIFRTQDGLQCVNAKHRRFLYENFEISLGQLFEENQRFDAVVCPADSFGFVDDSMFVRRFGWQLMQRMQDLIHSKDFCGELLVGQALIMETLDPQNAIKYLIIAPTMRAVTDSLSTDNAYLAFRGILLEVRKHNMLVSSKLKEGSVISSILCPGLGVIGEQEYDKNAHEMLKAYSNVVLGMMDPVQQRPRHLQSFHPYHRPSFQPRPSQSQIS